MFFPSGSTEILIFFNELHFVPVIFTFRSIFRTQSENNSIRLKNPEFNIFYSIMHMTGMDMKFPVKGETT